MQRDNTCRKANNIIYRYIDNATRCSVITIRLGTYTGRQKVVLHLVPMREKEKDREKATVERNE